MDLEDGVLQGRFVEKGVRVQVWRLEKFENVQSKQVWSLWWKYLKEVWASKEWGDKFEDRVKWELCNGKVILF